MGRDPRPRDRREPLLAAVVAGGATVAGMGAPSFIMTGGRTGAEYVYLGLQVISPAVLVVAGLIAVAVYRFAPSRVPHPVLAAITAATIWAVIRGLELVAPTIAIGLVSAYLTSSAALAAAGAVFVGLALAVGLRRRAVRAVRADGTDATAGTDAARWSARLPLAVTVAIAALAAGIPPAVAVIGRDLESRGSSAATSGADLAVYALLGALPAIVTAAWAVLVVLLVDEWSSPRVLRAIGAAAMTAIAIAVPVLVIGGGLEHGGEPAVVGLASGAASGVVVFASERRRVAAAPTDAAEPATTARR